MKLSIISSLFFFSIVSLFACTSSDSQSNSNNPQSNNQPDVTGANQSIDVFFKKYQDEGTSKAVDYIFSSNLSLINSSQLSDLKSKLDSTRKIIGNFEGQELITQKHTSNSLVLFSYLVKHDKQPLRFTFIFYKPKTEWTLYKFKYDDQADSELEESGKIYFIK